MKPLLIIVYDFGSAGPADLVAAARGVCDVVFVADPRRQHVADNLSILRAAAPVIETASSADAVATAVAVLRPAGITTFSESRIELTASVAQRLGLRYHDPVTASALTDKLAQRDAFAGAGVPTARHRAVLHRDDIRAAVAAIGLPAVLKPRRGAGSVDTYKLLTIDDCHLAADALDTAAATGRAGGGFVVEELLTGDAAAAGPGWGDYVSVESVVAEGDVRHVAVTGKFPLAEPFRETGQFLPATLAPDLSGRVTALTSEALRALGVRHGVTHTEVKLTPRGPRIIEVNGRVGGYVSDLLRRSCGFDLLRAAMQVAVGVAPDATVQRFRRIAFRRYLAAPHARAALVELGGMDRVAALPGVEHVEVRARAGQILDWRNGTQEALGVVYGHARDHDALRRLIRDVDACVAARYAPAPDNTRPLVPMEV
jgi:biotin carboxylase